MNNKKKVLIAGAMAAIFSISGQFVQTQSFGIQKAEAGLLGGGGLGGIGKSIAGKALNIDVDQMQDKRKNMILNLSKSAICYAQAAIDVSEALGLDDGQRAKMVAALSNLKNNRTDLESIKQVGNATKFEKADIENAAKNLMDSGEQAKIDAANTLIKKAKSERQAANLYKIMALRDAGMIISDSAKALAQGDSLGDKINVVKDLSSVANSAKAVADVIGSNHKVMTNALKEYEKKNNIPEVKDKDADKLMKEAGLN